MFNDRERRRTIILNDDLLEHCLVEVKSIEVKEHKRKKDLKYPCFATYEIQQNKTEKGYCNTYVTVNVFLAGGVSTGKINGMYQEAEIVRFT